MPPHLLIKSVYPVQPDDTVLLHAGTGGVGLILTQWATSLGAWAITTASTAHTRRAGAVEVLDYIPTMPSSSGPGFGSSATAGRCPARLLTYRVELLPHHPPTIAPDTPPPTEQAETLTGQQQFDLDDHNIAGADLHEPPPDPY